MRQRLWRHFRNNTIGYIALFVALGGTSYAAVQLPPGSVTTREVKDRSLLARDFKRGQLPKGSRGVPGVPGPQGSQGIQGPPGTPDTSNFYTKADSDSRFLGKSDKARDSDNLDGLDSTDLARILFAYVQDTTTSPPTILESRGAVSVTRGGTGLYDVVFNRSITGCAVTATLHYRTGGADLTAGRSGLNQVTVDIRTQGSGPGVNKDFTLLVSC